MYRIQGRDIETPKLDIERPSAKIAKDLTVSSELAEHPLRPLGLPMKRFDATTLDRTM